MLILSCMLTDYPCIKQRMLRNAGKCMYLKYDKETFGASGQIENKTIDFIKPWAGPYTIFHWSENPFVEN